jgi:hypothetical protein
MKHSFGVLLLACLGLASVTTSCKKVKIKPINETQDTETAPNTGLGGENDTATSGDPADGPDQVADTASAPGDTVNPEAHPTSPTQESDSSSLTTETDTARPTETDTDTTMNTDTDTGATSASEAPVETDADTGAGGLLTWARRAGGVSRNWGRAITALPDGSLLLTGSFGGTATFGPGEANETVLTSAEFDDVFIAKYDRDGALVWAKRAGGASYDSSFDIAPLPGGSSLVTGYFEGDVTFGPGEARETSFTSAGGIETFVARYGPDGALAWVKRATGGALDWGVGVATLPDESFYLTGNFDETVTLGVGEAGERTLVAEWQMDIYLARHDAAGDLIWVKQFKGTDYDWGSDIAVLGDGSVILIAAFEGNAVFEAGKETEASLSAVDGTDIFMIKYSADGVMTWVKHAGGSQADWVGGLAVHPDGSFNMSGYFEGTITFGAGEARETSLAAEAERDVFIARYRPDGTLAWARRAGSSALSRSNDIAALEDGSAVAVGYFEESITFGPGEARETLLTSIDGFDIFMARYTDVGDLLWARRMGGIDLDKTNDMALSDVFAVVTGYFAGDAVFGAGETSETTLVSDGDEDIFIAKFAI